MTLAISIHEAKINTVSVQIKTLTVTGKQVTLAVFRQIQRENIKAGDWGDPILWGHVNYHTKDCPHGRHVHVVWQKGDELRKADVTPPDVSMNDDYDIYDVPSAGAWIVAAVAEGWCFKGGPGYRKSITINFDDCVVKIIEGDLPEGYWEDLWDAGGKDGHGHWNEDRKQRSLEKLQKFCADGELHSRFLRQAIKKDLVDATIEREQFWKQWQEYLDLPHLFIAV